MSVWLAILLLGATINPPRRRSELPGEVAVVLVGAVLSLLVLVGMGAAGEPLLDALDITPPTFRVAVGLVLALRGTIDFFVGSPEESGESSGLHAAVVPVFFPVLFRPELGLLAISVAVDGGLGAMTLGIAVGLLLVVGFVVGIPDRRYDRALGLVFSTVLIALAIDRIVDGVFAL